MLGGYTLIYDCNMCDNYTMHFTAAHSEKAHEKKAHEKKAGESKQASWRQVKVSTP
jgi:hypothetical protein